MANTSVWAKPDPDLAALRAQMAPSPEPAPTVWAPMDDRAPRALPAQPAPHVIWAPPHTAQDDAMNAQPVNMPDTGANLHAGLEKVFPPAQPQVALDPNPQHQIEGHLTNRLQQEYAKDAPWNPDDHGTMGKIGHVFSKIGGGLADTFLPGVVPGTSTYRHDTENNIAHELNSTIGDESQQALQGAQAGQATANAANLKSETENRPLQLAETAGEQGLKVGPDGTLIPQTAEEQSPGFKSKQQLEQAQIYGLKNPWAKLPDKEPLTNVDDINAGMTDRFQVLHPNQPLPKEYTLGPNSTKGDFERIDKLLTSSEGATSTQQQKEIANQMRAQTYALALQNSQNAQQARQQSEDAKSMKWVMGTDSKGNTVALPLGQAQSQNLQNLAELPSTELKDMFNARHAVKLATQVGDPKAPETMGTLQLMDSLEKDGKLGIAASRMNKFLTRGLGSEPGDDPRIAALLNKADLFTTGIMLAHFGASGGRSPQMLQHFVEMADTGKMDGPTLKAGTKALVNYMQDRAMMPQGGQQQGGNEPQGATQEVWLGGKLAGHVVNGAYVPLGGK